MIGPYVRAPAVATRQLHMSGSTERSWFDNTADNDGYAGENRGLHFPRWRDWRSPPETLFSAH